MVWGHTMTPRSLYIYSFHMPLFFFLSGYVHRTKPFRHFILSKINTLYVPYMSFTLFSWLFYLIRLVFHGRRHLLPQHMQKLQSLFTGTANNGGNNPIWFLSCILGVSVLFFLLEHFIKRPVLRWAIILSLSMIGYYWGLIHFELLFQIEIALTGLVFFSFGHAVKEKNLLQRLMAVKPLQVVCLVLILEAFHIISAYFNGVLSPIRWVNMAGNVIGNYFLFYISALAGIVVYTIIGYKLCSIRILNYLGLNTLAILGFHKPVLQIFESVLRPFIDLHAWYYGITASIAAIAISLFLGFLMNKYLPIVIGKKPLFRPLNHKENIPPIAPDV